MKAVNLIPGDQRAGSSGLTGRSGGAALIVLGLLVGLAALIAMYGGAHRQITSQSGQVAALNAQTSAVEARTGKLTAYASFVSMADQRVQTVAQLVQSRFDWSHSLHELGRVLPADASLTSLNGTVGAASESSSSSSGAAPTSSTPPGSTPVFTVSGCATSQSEVAQTLQRLRLIDGASEVQLQSSTKSASGGGSASGGVCPSGYPVFLAQITFAGLPSAPAPAAPTGTPASTTSTTQSTTSAEPVSAQGKEVPR